MGSEEREIAREPLKRERERDSERAIKERERERDSERAIKEREIAREPLKRERERAIYIIIDPRDSILVSNSYFHLQGDIWAESWHIGIFWRYYACMEGAVYDISEWASCQRDNLKHLQANTHSVQYRIVSGKKSGAGTGGGRSEKDLEGVF